MCTPRTDANNDFDHDFDIDSQFAITISHGCIKTEPRFGPWCNLPASHFYVASHLYVVGLVYILVLIGAVYRRHDRGFGVSFNGFSMHIQLIHISCDLVEINVFQLPNFDSR